MRHADDAAPPSPLAYRPSGRIEHQDVACVEPAVFRQRTGEKGAVYTSSDNQDTRGEHVV